MSGSREPDRGEAVRWLRYAREDAALATRLAADGETPPRITCWHAQQAAEKALKAALITLGTEFPRTHNLVSLRALLGPHTPVGLAVSDLAELTAWATDARYPGDAGEPSAREAARAAEAGARVVDAVERHIGDLSQSGP